MIVHQQSQCCMLPMTAWLPWRPNTRQSGSVVGAALTPWKESTVKSHWEICSLIQVILNVVTVYHETCMQYCKLVIIRHVPISPFSSVSSMTNLRTDEYEYHWLYENVSLIIVFERKCMYYHGCSKNLYCIFDLSTEKVTRIEMLFVLKGMHICAWIYMLTRSEHRHSNNNRFLIATDRCNKYSNYNKLLLGIFILVCRMFAHCL